MDDLLERRKQQAQLKAAGLDTIGQAGRPATGSDSDKQLIRVRVNSAGSTRDCFYVNNDDKKIAPVSSTNPNLTEPSSVDGFAVTSIGIPDPIIRGNHDANNYNNSSVVELPLSSNGVSSSPTSTVVEVGGTYPPLQQEQIRYFSEMAQKNVISPLANYDKSIVPELTLPPPPWKNVQTTDYVTTEPKYQKQQIIQSDDYAYSNNNNSSDRLVRHHSDSIPRVSCFEWLCHLLDPTDFLMSDVKYSPDGTPYFDDNMITVASGLRHFFYDPINPEFTSLQQFNWAVIIGICMGVYTAFWKWYIQFGVHLFWKTIPSKLYEWSIFTDVDGIFPLYHYMWICPMTFGATLSYIFVVLPNPVPSQDAWITNVHTKGVQEHSSFFACFLLSTAAMWSGLSLGPELPLVLTGGMFGSFFAVLTKQSILQARVLNLTAASAAVGGFFGFPMAGALFVLEIPHRMGLQYFEALSPGTIATIVAVLTNSTLTGSEVTGYFKFPFLQASLPSWLFFDAIAYGFYGALMGIFYVTVVKNVKKIVHEMFAPKEDIVANPVLRSPGGKVEKHNLERNGEKQPLLTGMSTKSPRLSMKGTTSNVKRSPKSLPSTFCVIENKALRATIVGALVGIVVGVVGMYLPHTMFWGEQQLQNLIDKGRTPLPIFSFDDDDPLSVFTKFAICIVNPDDPQSVQKGFGIECTTLLIVVKTIVIGLCVGTGVVAGQFWGPLYVGCAGAHLLTDVCIWFETNFHFGGRVTAFPCIAMICTMGGAHVVMFRSHMGIMLILTLTISAFNSGDDRIKKFGLAGDYSAIFPLLVVSVFISLMASRKTVMYSAQRSRGDITAVPAVLCQPNMEGAPVVVQYHYSYDDDDNDDDDFDYSYDNEDYDGDNDSNDEKDTEANNNSTLNVSMTRLLYTDDMKVSEKRGSQRVKDLSPRSSDGVRSTIPHPPPGTAPLPQLEQQQQHQQQHHRVYSSMTINNNSSNTNNRTPSPTIRSSKHARVNSKELVRIVSFGQVDEPQPSLLDQARTRSASGAGDASQRSQHRRVPSIDAATAAHAAAVAAAGGGGDVNGGAHQQQHHHRNQHRRVPSLPLDAGFTTTTTTTSTNRGGDPNNYNQQQQHRGSKHRRVPSLPAPPTEFASSSANTNTTTAPNSSSTSSSTHSTNKDGGRPLSYGEFSNYRKGNSPRNPASQFRKTISLN